MSFKTFVFLTLLCGFLLTTPALILYSQGYRVDFDSFSLVQTGGLFVKTHPASALISLDSKQRSATSRYFGTKFIQNLLPKEYTLEIAKAGFISWKKKVKIQERQTNEFRDIFLVPESPKDTRIGESVETFAVDPHHTILIAIARPTKSNDLTFLRILLQRPENNDSFTFRGGLHEALSSPIAIDDIFDQDQLLIHSVSSQKKNTYFLINLAAMTIKPVLINVPGAVHTILFHPQNSNFLIAYIGSTLARIQISDYSFIPLVENISFFTMHGDQGFVIKKDMQTIIAFLLENPDTHQEEKKPIGAQRLLFQKTLPVKYLSEAFDFDIVNAQHIIILLNNDVYLNHPESAEWELILKNIQHIKPVGKRVFLAWNDNTIWLINQENIDGKKEVLSPKLAARYHDPIGRVYPFGIDATSIIFTIDKRIEIRELSFDNQENVASFPIETNNIFFDTTKGMLYFLRDKNLYQRYLYP